MKISITLLILFSSFNLFAQKHKKKQEDLFYLFDAQGNSVKSLEKATTYMVLIKENDTTYVTRDYQNNGPMIWQQTFKDKDLTIPNGRFVWYDKDGSIDSTGIAINGQKDGVWMFFTPVLYTTHGRIVVNDSLIKSTYYQYGKQINKKSYYGDSDENSALKRTFFKTGVPISEEEFNLDKTGKKRAAYPTGPKGWRYYLITNLNSKLGTLIPAYKKLTDNKAPVTTSFIVGKDGSVDDVFISKSAGYPFDNEAMRVIKNSGKWIPAQQFGHVVTYRQTQKIIFSASY
ncbi:energy transducer TonB [Arachidicoccus sp.]|uniref:energy transducer TonB n=1 Tax=Arachidicoccus sp. TaxID=1872624 RepID=UPI003D21B3F0